MNKKLQIPISHINFFLPASLKDRLHHWGYLSNPHQLSSTSQASALARKKRRKHVPIALPRQHKGMFDWAAASVRRRWNSTAGRNLRSCTLHQGLLFLPSLSCSLCCDPFSPSYHGCSLFFSHRSRQRCALALSLTMWNQIALSCHAQLPSVCGCRLTACLCVCCTTETLAKKLSNLKHHRLISDCSVLFLFFFLVLPVRNYQGT